ADRLGSFGYPADTYGAQSGLKGVFYPAVPPVSIASMTGFGTNFGGQIYNPNWMVPINGDLSWSKGNHSLKFGVQYVSQNFINKVSSNSTGTYNFNQRETGLPGCSGGHGVRLCKLPAGRGGHLYIEHARRREVWSKRLRL